LFIPDISGFTQFVNETEITHSQHIIEELLDVVIEANSMDLKISEIEGDAIFFYKMSGQITAEAVARQAKRMFIAFHRHLKLYEQRRICHCGACSTAGNLGLKIIAHQSHTITTSHIRGHEKLFGPDVILVHRLLKNDIPEREYLLTTESIPLQNLTEMDWAECKEGSAEYDGVKVHYRYINMKPLHSEVPLPPQPQVNIYRTTNPMVFEKIINAPADRVYTKLIDLPNRMNFMDGVLEVKVHDEKRNRMNKIGTRHACVMEKDVNDLITSDVKFSEGRMQFSETGAKVPFTCDFIAEAQNGKTKLMVLFHTKLKFPMSLMFRLFMRKKLARSMQTSMENFRRLCEGS